MGGGTEDSAHIRVSSEKSVPIARAFYFLKKFFFNVERDSIDTKRTKEPRKCLLYYNGIPGTQMKCPVL